MSALNCVGIQPHTSFLCGPAKLAADFPIVNLVNIKIQVLFGTGLQLEAKYTVSGGSVSMALVARKMPISEDLK